MSAGNFDIQCRWDDQAAVVPVIIKGARSINIENPNEFLHLLTPGFYTGAKGADMFCLHSNKIVRVFIHMFVILGDLPGRCDIGIIKFSIVKN